MAENALDYEKIREYRTKGDKYCLVLKSGDQPALPYQINMIRYNQIGTLLPIQFFMEDGRYQYYYDISHTESLAMACSYKKMKWNQVLSLLTQLYKTVARMEDFLLELDGLLLLPEYIYWNQEKKEYWFCYYPDKKESFEASLWELLEYFLNHIDYKDDHTVKMVYELYQKVRKEHVPLARIIESYSNYESCEPCGMEESRNTKNSLDIKQNPSWWNQDEKGKKESLDKEKDTKQTLSSEKGKGFWQNGLSYIPDVIGALLVARMAYYLFQHHASMSGPRFLLWLGGILMIVGVSACWASYLGKKEEEDKNLLVDTGPMKKTGKREIRTEADFNYIRKDEEIEIKESEESVYEEDIFHGESSWNQKELSDYHEEIRETVNPFVQDKIPKTLVMNQEVLVKGRCPVLVAFDKKISKDIVLSKKQMVIGKVRGFVDVYLDDACISRVHAQINQEEGGTTIMDLGSTNGSYVNGRKLGEQERMLLHQGDEVMLAGLRFQFLQDFS